MYKANIIAPGVVSVSQVWPFQVQPQDPAAGGFEVHRGSGNFPRTNFKVILVFENFSWSYLGVSKNRGTPKWMVNNGKPY